MAVKKPICHYSGKYKELQSGDTISLDDTSDGSTSKLGQDCSTTGSPGFASISASRSTFPVGLFERTSTSTNSLFSVLQVRHKTSSNMVDGFGAGIRFDIEDDTSGTVSLGNFGVIRKGADNSGAFRILTANSGSVTQKFTIEPDGKCGIKTITPASVLEVNGSIGAKSTTKNADFTADESVYHYRVTTGSSTDKTATLPVASTCTDRIYVFTKVDAGTNSLIIDGNSSETINGATTLTLAHQYDTVTIQCTGTEWIVISIIDPTP